MSLNTLSWVLPPEQVESIFIYLLAFGLKLIKFFTKELKMAL